MQHVLEEISGVPLVSVIVPVYDVEKYLCECLDSIIGQTLKNIEIILIDDGSPDNSGRICDEYAERDNRIIVIHQENAGVSAARNTGFKKASGNYVIFYDSDDVVPEDACEALYNEASVTDADVVIGNCCFMYVEKEINYRTFSKPFVTDERGFIDDIVKMVFYHTYNPLKPTVSTLVGLGAPWQKLVRKELLVKHQVSFDSRVKGVHDDCIWSAQVIYYSRRIAYIDKPVYRYRQVASSLINGYKKNACEISTIIYAVWEEFLKKAGTSIFDEALAANTLQRLVRTLLTYFCNKKYEYGFKTCLNKLNDFLASDMYQLSYKKVDSKLLTSYHRAIYYAGRTQSALIVWTVFKSIALIKNVRAKIRKTRSFD